jgi:hypothetical protein
LRTDPDKNGVIAGKPVKKYQGLNFIAKGIEMEILDHPDDPEVSFSDGRPFPDGGFHIHGLHSRFLDHRRLRDVTGKFIRKKAPVQHIYLKHIYLPILITYYFWMYFIRNEAPPGQDIRVIWETKKLPIIT